MSVPPLSAIQNATITMNSKVVPALEVIIIPGYYSDPKMLKFNYTITNYDPT